MTDAPTKRFDGPQKAVVMFLFTFVVAFAPLVGDGISLEDVLTAIGLSAAAGGLTWAVPNKKRSAS